MQWNAYRTQKVSWQSPKPTFRLISLHILDSSPSWVLKLELQPIRNEYAHDKGEIINAIRKKTDTRLFKGVDAIKQWHFLQTYDISADVYTNRVPLQGQRLLSSTRLRHLWLRTFIPPPFFFLASAMWETCCRACVSSSESWERTLEIVSWKHLLCHLATFALAPNILTSAATRFPKGVSLLHHFRRASDCINRLRHPIKNMWQTIRFRQMTNMTHERIVQTKSSNGLTRLTLHYLCINKAIDGNKGFILIFCDGRHLFEGDTFDSHFTLWWSGAWNDPIYVRG